MESRPQNPNDRPLMEALATVRTAAYVLRDLDFGALDELDRDAVAEWEASLVKARKTLVRVLRWRGCEELEVPPRGQLDHFDEARVKHHVQGISKALRGEFQRVDATQGAIGEISTSIIFGLLYSVRSVEQFIRWLDPAERSRPRVRQGPAAPAAEPPAAPAEPPPAVVALPPPVQVPPAAEEPFEPHRDLDLGPVVESLPPLVPAPAPAAPPEPATVPTGFPPSLPPRASLAPSLPPATPPAPVAERARPRGYRRDVDLRGYYERPDEYGAALRMAPVSVFHGCARGPELAKRERCLDATCVMEVPGGVAFALADGPDSSIGAGVAAVIATTAFCEHLVTGPEDQGDVRGAITAAAGEAHRRLETLLESLVDSADDSEAITRLRGALPVQTVRRVLEHTLRPDPNLRHVTPALAVSLLAGVLVRSPRDTHELTLLSVGGFVAERKHRGQVPEVLLPVEGSTARFAPGAAVPWQPASVPVYGPIELDPGDLVVLGSPTLRRGYWGAALDNLAQLCPEILQLSSPHDDHALQVLRQAGAAADRYEALLEKRARSRTDPQDRASPSPSGVHRQPLLAGDLSMVLLTVAASQRTPTGPLARSGDAADRTPLPLSDAAAGATRDALSTLVRLLRKPPGR